MNTSDGALLQSEEQILDLKSCQVTAKNQICMIHETNFFFIVLTEKHFCRRFTPNKLPSLQQQKNFSYW